MWRKAREVVHMYQIAFVSTSATVHFSSTLDSRNSSSRAAKRTLQPPFQSNKVPLSAEPANTIAKCVYLAKKRVELLCIKSSFSSATERHKKLTILRGPKARCGIEVTRGGEGEVGQCVWYFRFEREYLGQTHCTREPEPPKCNQ